MRNIPAWGVVGVVGTATAKDPTDVEAPEEVEATAVRLELLAVEGELFAVR